MTKVTVACIQMQSGPDIAPNLARAGQLIHEAKKQGAELIVLPENATAMVRERQARVARAFPESEHEAVKFFAAQAREEGIWLVAGSLSIRMTPDKMANRCLVFNPLGAIMGRYDKIHLYDADPKPGESYRESADIQPGKQAVLVETPWAKLGLTICYDLRFASLFRRLAKAGASIITVPSAFTVPTGEAHWHVLLRARAIETGCYILAPAQTGTHDSGRKTYGHSLIISPWGEILKDAGEGEGIITATLDLARVAEARKAIMSLQHDREFEGP
jgi:predicted amidohydrolase